MLDYVKRFGMVLLFAGVLLVIMNVLVVTTFTV
ncbi:hypothetical protein JOD17_002664 [Geomicrobium sediminis]|uniref:Uncharacterized protein n=1 Tax=Geomicrobium sediminis TaxID=1347788 RepID=A0ABS2PDT2_9BACL|nr:hypothetical protein [Geomicrobium sediminis]